MASTAKRPTTQRMTGLGSLMGETKIPAPRSGVSGRGGQLGRQSTGLVALQWQKRRSDITRMDV